jgi:DNA-binding CsgD family transcriptional regulator
MSQTQPLFKVIEVLYDAGTDPERWHDALGTIEHLMNARMCALGLFSPNALVTEIIHGGDPSYIGKMKGMEDQNLWYQRRHRAPLNKAVAGEQLASSKELKRTRVYSEIMQPNDVLHMCGVGFLGNRDIFGALCVLRSEKDQAFGPAELDRLDTIVPHILRAARISSLLQGVDLYNAGLEAAANRLTFGLLLIDRHGRVLFANGEVERLMAAGRIACRRDGRLAWASGSKRQELSSFLDQLTLTREVVTLCISDLQGRDLKLIGAPLPERRRDFACLAPVAHSMIFLFDEAAIPPSPICLITKLYGLTPAESRLAEALLAGQSLADYGDRAGLTRNTLKTHLRSLFDKTETARQSELVRRLARFGVFLADS